ncbi:FAD-dependent oxidoreductase [Colwellia sp. E2M01]|uniref:FAD-dependent oxidoreductase n=1 Tax=Colwellia sp. E2M01 TaxID=2841561 RepID=UPI001C090098|nr:FAD-dependent oxidoreductase [Colwellia sp. E2M01]MBU2869511.1 FAD-binding oxidoreductase [Colwellia sp. E2M01]
MNIAIVGAGLMGRLLALSLLRKQQSDPVTITLFDKDTKQAHNSAAYAAAGLLTPLGESLHCEPNIVEMGFKSLALWPTILDSLQEHTIFQQTGAIMVSHEQDKGDYQRFVRHLKNNYPDDPVQTLDRAGLTALEPEIGRSFNQGLYLPEEGQVGNRRLLIALRKQLELENENENDTDSELNKTGKITSNKLQWLSACTVVDIEVSIKLSTVKYLHNNEEQSRQFDLVIDCRGTGASLKNSRVASTSNSSSTDSSNKDCAPLTDLRSVRGELFQLFAPDVNISRPIRLMHPRYQLYIAPKGNGYYVVGATEIESDDMSPMTVRSAMELLSAAYSVHPGFAEANIRQHVSQCRPAFSDNQPKIIVQDSLIQVNGLYRHGYLIAPVVLEQSLAVITNFLNNTNNALPHNDLLPVTVTGREEQAQLAKVSKEEPEHEHSY